jgi:hypothetical protein
MGTGTRECVMNSSCTTKCEPNAASVPMTSAAVFLYSFARRRVIPRLLLLTDSVDTCVCQCRWGLLYEGPNGNGNTLEELTASFAHIIGIFREHEAPVVFQLNINANNGESSAPIHFEVMGLFGTAPQGTGGGMCHWSQHTCALPAIHTSACGAVEAAVSSLYGAMPTP